MEDQTINLVINKTIGDVLGIEPADLHSDTDFHLDLNASPEELEDIKNLLETQLDIVLPPFTAADPATLRDLHALVEDSML